MFTNIVTSSHFPLGRVSVTPDAQEAVDGAGITVSALLDRHMRGDHGVLSPEDENPTTLIFSDYVLRTGARIYVFTTRDYRETRVMTATEY